MSDELIEIRADIKKLLDMAKTDHVIIESLQRRARLATFFHIGKWLIIIGISIGAFIYVQPVLEKFVDVYKSLSGGMGGENSNIFDIFNPFK